MITERSYQRIVVIGIVAAGLLLGQAQPATASEAAEDFIQHCADDVSAILSNQSETLREKRSDIWQIIDRSTNSEQLARATLGNYAAGLPQREIDRYVRAFRRYMRFHFAGELASASSLDLRVTGSSETRRSHATRVSSKVSLSGGEEREVDWRVADDEFITDVQVDGLWLISDLKSRINTLLLESNGNITAAVDYINRDLPDDD